MFFGGYLSKTLCFFFLRWVRAILDMQVCLHTPMLTRKTIVLSRVCQKLYKEEMQAEEIVQLIHIRVRIRAKLATFISIYVSYLQVSCRAAAVSLSAITVVLLWRFFQPLRLPRGTGAVRKKG